MINFLRGVIEYKGKDYLVIDIRDIGYQIFVSEKILTLCSLNQELKLFTYQHIRENVMDLYGFLSREELEFFEILLSVSGIGPKSAMNIISKADAASIKNAVAQGDVEILITAHGIGKKTAARIVMELKNKIKINVDASSNAAKGEPEEEVLDALTGLGYNRQEILEVLKKVPNQVASIEEKIKWALKNIAKL